MRFYTTEQCEHWLRDRKRPDGHSQRIPYPKEPYRVFSFARSIAQALPHGAPALLSITEWGIWPSSENWHLYYKLRQSYADARLLEEAPGHLFLAHETADLASFLQVAMLNGWDGHLFTEANYVNARFSHDEYIDLFAETESTLAPVLGCLSS